MFRTRRLNLWQRVSELKPIASTKWMKIEATGTRAFFNDIWLLARPIILGLRLLEQVVGVVWICVGREIVLAAPMAVSIHRILSLDNSISVDTYLTAMPFITRQPRPRNVFTAKPKWPFAESVFRSSVSIFLLKIVILTYWDRVSSPIVSQLIANMEDKLGNNFR